MYATIVSPEMATPAFVDRRAFQCLQKGLQRAARPVPEREAAHLGDAIAGPRTLLFSQPPQAAQWENWKTLLLTVFKGYI